LFDHKSFFKSFLVYYHAHSDLSTLQFVAQRAYPVTARFRAYRRQGLPSESPLNVDTKHEDLPSEWVKKLNRRQAWTNILVLVDLAISLSILA
jgi:hypothetical protein